MKSCATQPSFPLLGTALATMLLMLMLIATSVQGFGVSPVVGSPRAMAALKMVAEKVEVCGFKDCRRAGGGKRLENFIATLLEEKELTGQVQVEGCDCQGECGYGPNLVVDGKLINDAKGRKAVLQALGLSEE